ncbi:anthranilate synthase family protein [Solicola gregarius]|uniref:anthranilate synthase n=1 Tax=Solicola gregarius TaxID=2908642 RepID=A0AA46YLP2_9ACTN|nr:anthranilate synthase family protein [Solicola gregarius]UYM07155.1 anthranilate synthase family protein [Solicola gregarius]
MHPERTTMSILDELLEFPAYAIIRLRETDMVTLVAGPREDIESLADVRVDDGAPHEGPTYDRLVVVPFAQVRERGFEAHQDGTPLSVIECEHHSEVPLDALLELLPGDELTFADRGGFETGDDEYARMVGDVIRDEIGDGEGANLVVARHYRARIADWGHRAAWSVLRRLLTREHGAHWTFCIFTGDRFLIGASPERHVSVEAGKVRMNPISGTFRLRGLETHAARKDALISFLRDEKEIYELFMVVDEELKMMCHICHEGGLVLGPYLKQMSHLVHTEYLLAGRTHRDVREVLRDTMFAATVTGSPVENACRLIKRYEQRGRGYYASIAALIGRDADGAQTADAPILIRTADVDLDGNLTVSAGATLVRDSDAAYETAETWAKASGVLSAFGLLDGASVTGADLTALTSEDDVLIALGERNQRLAQFWLSDQGDTDPSVSLRGKRVVVVDGEDDFVNMLGHVFGVLGMSTDLVRHDYYRPGALDDYDLVVVGPGPGDPRDGSDPKIKVMDGIVSGLLAEERPFLAVCLGHQVLAKALGLELAYKDIVFQGTQSVLPVGGHDETVGFYNTFVARVPESGLPAGVTVETDPATGDVHALTGPHYRSLQFHAESILTRNGFDIMRRVVTDLLRR